MSNQFKDYPICVNCKYYMDGPCGLTMINPVTGELEQRKNRQAAAYRKDDNPCGPSGIFFKPGKKKAEVKKKPPVIEPPRVSTAKVVDIDVPEIPLTVSKGIAVTDEKLLNLMEDKEEPPKKRRRSRSKQAE